MTTLSKSFQSPHPLTVALLASACATLASYAAPEAHAGEAVGFVFMTATYLACLRPSHVLRPEHYGLGLGGLWLPEPLSLKRMFRESLRALAVASLLGLLILPLFWLGFVEWYQPRSPFSVERAVHAVDTSPALVLINLSLAHLLVVALPEETFFRGYLQTALNDRYPQHQSWCGLRFSVGLFVSSAVFALGHFTTSPVLSRLAVFFPSLLFGLLREKTKGVGAALVLHAQCNVFAALLGRGYGLY